MIGKRAVVVYDHHGGDGMVTPDTYEEIRKNQFFLEGGMDVIILCQI